MTRRDRVFPLKRVRVTSALLGVLWWIYDRVASDDDKLLDG
jgi:hypothetical protein